MAIKNIFIILITSFSLIGVGGAISFCTYLNFYDNKDNLVTDHYNIKMNDNIILPAAVFSPNPNYCRGKVWKIW